MVVGETQQNCGHQRGAGARPTGQGGTGPPLPDTDLQVIAAVHPQEMNIRLGREDGVNLKGGAPGIEGNGVEVIDGHHNMGIAHADRCYCKARLSQLDFATGQARQRVVANFVPRDLVLADLGCGTGYVARAFLGLASRVICVDSSTGMLEEARRGLSEAPTRTEVELRAGELDALPLDDDEVDGAVCAMVLHHLESPAACLAEMFRVVRPGGSVVLLELAPHREAWMHEALGDRHLGLDGREVARAVEAAGFVDVELEAPADRYRPRVGDGDTAGADLPLYLIRGRVPAASRP